MYYNYRLQSYEVSLIFNNYNNNNNHIGSS